MWHYLRNNSGDEMLFKEMKIAEEKDDEFMYEKLCHLSGDHFSECNFIFAPGGSLLLPQQFFVYHP